MRRLARMRREDGFGLVELLIAMTMLAIGLAALLAAFSPAIFGVRRASNLATATALADQAMETYHIMIYDHIGVDTTAAASADSTYKNDDACYDTASGKNCTQTGSPSSKKLTGPYGQTCTTINAWYPEYSDGTNAMLPCTPSVTLLGPDGHSYRIDQYVATQAASGTPQERAHKNVTVVVRDGGTGMTLAREQAVFDCATGGGSFLNSSGAC